MSRSGGIAGSYDGKGVNDILARENKARGEMIDSMVRASGGNGGATIGEVAPGKTQNDLDNAEKTARWRQEDLIGKLGRGNDGAIAAAINANARSEDAAGSSAAHIRSAELQKQAALYGHDVNSQRAAESNRIQMRGQDLAANEAAARTGIDRERLGIARDESRRADQLSMPQRRSNAEIEAARQAVAGLTPEDIKRRTANFTATGRENPDYDPTLAKAVSQANRRMYGEADDWFDNRLQPKQPAGTNEHGYDRADVAKRFREERAMNRHRLGNDTPNGVEVLDSDGKVIGHYR